MPAVSGMGTTYNLPNYGGELYLASPTDTKFLSAIGGLSLDNEDGIIAATELTWQADDIAAPQQPNILEGAAPVMEERARALFSNVAQIFQYGVDVSYSKLGATAQLANMGNGATNPVQSELARQTRLKLRTAARDINWTFLNGAYNKPSDNTTARKTRGLVAAITTNVVTNGTAAALTDAMVNTLLQNVWTARGIHQELEPTFVCGAFQKQQLSKIFITQKGYQERSRNVGGVAINEIDTEFGRINVMLERDAPAAQLVFAHLGVCMPKFLLIPDKGFLFLEPLGKTGASEKWQLYGEVGLHYGDEGLHGKITNLTTS